MRLELTMLKESGGGFKAVREVRKDDPESFSGLGYRLYYLFHLYDADEVSVVRLKERRKKDETP